MQDLIAIGETWFGSQRREHLATEVSYQPVIGTTRTVRATVVVGRWESIDSAGQMLRTETQDFFVDTTDLAQDPKKGDKIVAGSFTYQVMIPPGAEHHWRWSDRNKTLRRIHTMVTEGPATRSPTVPGAPTIFQAAYDGEPTGTNVQWSAPTSDGGAAITGYIVYFDDAPYTPTSVVGSTYYQFATNYMGLDAKVSAVNAVGEGPKSAPVQVTA